jgi:anti-anti-sigma regulatory factor
MLVGTVNGRIFVRVEGRATHLNSQPLREFLEVMLQRGHRDLDLDMKECIFLDSTFVGVLAVIALRVRGPLAGTVRLFNASERCLELFRGLGVERYFNVISPEESAKETLPGPQDLDVLPAASRTRAAWATTILEAHRVLTEADPTNLPRLRDVLELMEHGPPDPSTLAPRDRTKHKN